MCDNPIACDRCEFQFDAMDSRGWVHTKTPRALCPYCCVEVLHGSQAWCVWNDCQGIWPETVQPRRADAERFINTTHGDIGGRVVPVIVFPDQNDGMRNWAESRDHGKDAA
jgi:hypothetical protein